MRAAKATIISATAMVLLAGSAASVLAQEDESGSVDVFFSTVGFLDRHAGYFTDMGVIPGGTYTVVDSMWEPPAVAATYRFDPGDPGGDTFDISVNGAIRGEWEPTLIHGAMFWRVVPDSGTGEYAGLSGKGEALLHAHGEGGWRTETYTGAITGPASE